MIWFQSFLRERYTKPLGDIIDPLFHKYKFSSSIADVFLFNAATNSIYARADYEALTAGAFDNQRILISIRGHHRQNNNDNSMNNNSFVSTRRDALVHDAGVSSAGGGVGAEALSRASAFDRYDDQRGPLTAADLAIPDWLNPSPTTAGGGDGSGGRGGVSHRHRTAERKPSHHSSASSLSVKSGVEDDDVVDADGDFAGAMVLPSPDAASMLFASAMGHAADASLGDSATRIDLGLANLDSPEVARNASTSISSLAGKLEQRRRHHHDDDDRSW